MVIWRVQGCVMALSGIPGFMCPLDTVNKEDGLTGSLIGRVGICIAVNHDDQLVGGDPQEVLVISS